MNRFFLAWLTISFGWALTGSALAADTKTDLRRDVILENSTTNFVLSAKLASTSDSKKASFDVSAPDAGDYLLVCFVNRKPLKPVKFKSPGNFELSTRGLAPGSYRITLQLIDSQGRVGSSTHTLQLK